jgi:glycosyltransferase involved in cell wall biosynthesis
VSRVLFFSQAPGVGGGERVALSGLAAVDDVDVVVAGPTPVTRYARELGFESRDFDLPRAHKPVHALRALTGSARVRRLAHELRANVLYANGTRAIPYALGARALGGPPVVFHHHGLLTTGAVRTLARAVDRFADIVVVPSRASAEPFRRADKIRLVPNGIDLARFHPPAERPEAKRRWGLDPSALVVGTVTRPDPTKGMGRFLDLVERVAGEQPRTRFLLAGGPVFPHEREPYRRIVERAARLGPEVVTTGPLSDPVAAYQAMDVFVHLAEPEGFGLTVVEAMACGVSVVAYRWGGVGEILDGLPTLVPPHDLDAAAGAVMRLSSDGDHRTAAAAGGRARCEERYGLEKMVSRLAAVLEEVGAVSTR